MRNKNEGRGRIEEKYRGRNQNQGKDVTEENFRKEELESKEKHNRGKV